MKYTVFFDQVNRTNFQVEAKDEDEARAKADRLYDWRLELPSSYVQEGWVEESEGEDE